MPELDEKIELNCFVFGDVDFRPFPVSTSTGIKVAYLVEKILESYQKYDGTRAKLPAVHLFQIASNQRELPELRLPHFSDQLQLIRKVGTYWPNPHQIDQELVHVLVYFKGGQLLLHTDDVAPSSSYLLT
jgi:hypothetical protein